MPRQTQNDDADVIETATGPVRRCAATGDRAEQFQMVRFGRSPDGVVTPDIKARLPGRGVWTLATRAAVDKAAAKGGFARGFKAQVEIPPDLSDMVEGLLLEACQGLLGLARRSGAAVIGETQVRASLQKRAPGWLLEAADGAEDGRRKILALARAAHGGAPVSGALSAAELGMAFGRARVIHGLIVAGAFADRWGQAYSRLAGFRPAPEDNWLSGRRSETRRAASQRRVE